MKQRAIFLDKDGTIIPDIPYNVDPEQITLSPSVGECLLTLKKAGYIFIVVSNQKGIALGYFQEQALGAVKKKLDQLLSPYNVKLTDFYYCPHAENAVVKEYQELCSCRKPLPGMLEKAAREHAIDLQKSWMIGDIVSDIEAGNRVGCKTILLDGNQKNLNFDTHQKPDFTAYDFKEVKDIILHAQTIQQPTYTYGY